MLSFAALLLLTDSSAAQSFAEFPTSEFLGGIAAAPDGTVWCTVAGPSRIFGFDATGLIAQLSVPSIFLGGIVVGQDGALWFPAYREGQTFLGRVTRAGQYSDFVLPRTGSLPRSIVVAVDGTFWLGGENSFTGQLFHCTPSGAVTSFSIEVDGVAPAPDGGAWFTSRSTPTSEAHYELWRIFSDGSVTPYPQSQGAPGSTLSNLKLAADGSGSLWASSTLGKETSLVHLGPAGRRTDFPVPGFQVSPGYGAGANDIAPAADGSVWFVTGLYVTGTGLHPVPPYVVAPSRVGRLSPDGIVTQIDRGTFAVPHALAIAADGSLWFNEASRLVRLISGSCRSDPHALCLKGGRFRAQVAWRTPAGVADLGTAVSLTQDTAAFWFFTSNNLEIVVKVVDGLSVNGHFWVFIGALTNVQWEVTVLDTETGIVRRYSNPQGSLQSLADTSAF